MSPGRAVARWAQGHQWIARWWPVIAVGAFIVLGFVAFVIIGNLIRDVQEAQSQLRRQQDVIATNQIHIRETTVANRRLNCAVSKAITANPIVRIPQFESEAEFQRRVDALRLIVALVAGIDCNAVLAPITTGAFEAQPFPEALPEQSEKKKTQGGGAQPNNQGHQLPGPGSHPRPTSPPSPTPDQGGPGGGSPTQHQVQICAQNHLLPVCVRLGL